MAARTKVDVGYNVQIAVDASNRLIVVKDRPRGGRMLGGAKGLLDGCGAKIGSKAYLTTQQLCDESGRHVKLG
jgi:hypothetical protein